MKPKTDYLAILTIAALIQFSLPVTTATSGERDFPHPDKFVNHQIAAMQSVSLPDLVIRQVVAVAGDDKKLRAHIINVGNADAGGCNLLLFYQHNGQTVKRGTYVTAIAKGKDLWVDVNNDNVLAAASSISLRVDDPNRVKESNELNNSYKFK
jgi:hypothetical protein